MLVGPCRSGGARLFVSRCIREGDVKVALQEFSAFRSRVNKDAAAQGVAFAIEVDTRKQTPPDQRLCWFEGTDPLAGRVDAYSEAVTADIATDTNVVPAIGDCLTSKFTALANRGRSLCASFFLSRLDDDRRKAFGMRWLRNLKGRLAALRSKYELSLWTDGQIELGEPSGALRRSETASWWSFHRRVLLLDYAMATLG